MDGVCELVDRDGARCERIRAHIGNCGPVPLPGADESIRYVDPAKRAELLGIAATVLGGRPGTGINDVMGDVQEAWSYAVALVDYADAELGEQALEARNSTADRTGPVGPKYCPQCCGTTPHSVGFLGDRCDRCGASHS